MRQLLRKGALAYGAALCALLAAAAATPAQAQQRTFNLPPGRLADTIPEFARQAGLQVIVSDRNLPDVSTPPVAGQQDARAALGALIAGTGLAIASDNGSTIVLKRGDARPPEAPATGATDRGAAVDELVVTAQKRAERSIDVPMSIVAVTGQSLMESQATTLQDLQNRIPGLRVNGGRAGAEVVLRNVSIGAGINTNVGTYVDETAYGANGALGGATFFGLSIDPFDIARIEVLRGPQGTNYGAIAMAGILKYVTNAPDPSHFAARGLVGGSRVDGATGYEVHGMVNVPLGSTAALRVVAHDTSFPGYVDAPDRGKHDSNETTRRGVRTSLLWNATDNVTVRLNAEFQKLKVADADAFTIGATAAGYGPFIRTPAPFAVNSSNSQQIYSGTVNWDLGSVSLVSATSYTKAERRNLTDYAAISGLISSAAGGRYSAAIKVSIKPEVFNQEVRLASSTGGPLRWAIGGYYSHQSTPNFQFVNAFNLTTNAFEPQRKSSLGIFDVSLKYRELAGFANMNYDLTDRLTVGAGARYSDNKQSYHQETTGFIFGETSFTTPSSEDVFTYSVDAKYSVNGRNNIYGRIATGFVPGGPNNVVPGSNLPSDYGSSTTTNYEIGIKGALGSVFTYDIAAFQIDWKDIQLQAVFENLAAITNGGSARNRGVEVALGITPARGLAIDLAATYTDARLTENTPPSSGGRAGQRLPNAPYFSSNVSVRYDWALSENLDAFAGFDWAYTGGRLTLFSATQPRRIIKAYTTVDARIGLSRGKYRATLYAKNIFDQQTLSSLTTATYDGVQQLRGQITSPRTVGVTFSAQY